LADFPEVVISYADKLMVMGNSKDSRVFNFAILLTKYTCFTVLCVACAISASPLVFSSAG